ncbi:unnamed protein product [Protopolystoma xenopodis]|uniref:Uncharacterized protein n=1 Tax=Protopolystoma xenopodis TaxID=117903 RepID=A0A448X706_9PLAT|nr:unnamed protein product [Protopolystoma xenopodis]
MILVETVTDTNAVSPPTTSQIARKSLHMPDSLPLSTTEETSTVATSTAEATFDNVELLGQKAYSVIAAPAQSERSLYLASTESTSPEFPSLLASLSAVSSSHLCAIS